MEKKNRNRDKNGRKVLNKNQEVLFGHEFKVADRAGQR
ncbi:YfhE family protein [Pseudalkalibacillus caeni]|uniref:YfhE family protein n=1 Tax=Exobacillus caeni TaxID=2574798 RepID=A0A5R9EZ38_9BACL|nr:YfhE family protein [Pseudalkalibacillus caeni]TLS35719.1 YfhE family protein [Pseudalkalibacillus caeni]